LLIAGIGDVLLGDAGIGPFIIKVLKARYDVPENVEFAEFGTHPLELPRHVSGADTVILVNSANFRGAPGDVRLFRKNEILRISPPPRIDPYSPALRESLSHLDAMGRMPSELLLIAVQGRHFGPGSILSPAVRQSIPHVIDAVVRELYRRDVRCEAKATAARPRIWWDYAEAAA
jgi:hydrogenase maturation protease